MIKNKVILFLYSIIFFISIINCGKTNFLKFELYAIKYGDSKFSSKYIFYNDKENKYYNFAWLFYAIKYENKIILIDTGFNNSKLIEEYKIKFYDPFLILKDLKIKPDEVTDIILTHSHFDHIGNVDKFMNANIYIQKDELNSFLKYSELIDIKKYLNNNSKIITYNNSFELYNFIKIKKIGGHTIGSSIIELNYNSKKYIITGDECYLFDNFILKKPVGSFFNHKKNTDFIENLDYKNYVILTFHESGIVVNTNFKKIIP